MMTLPRLILIALHLAGRPSSVWVVGFLAMIAARADGAGGFDAVIIATGPAILWLCFSWVCRFLTRGAVSPFGGSTLPTNKPLPKAQLAVVVAPDHAPEAYPAPARMVERLPENVRRLVRPADRSPDQAE